MSGDTLPITPARFAAAIKDLPLASLHLKVLELRNSIAHLDYSNEQLRPFAEGTETALGSGASGPGRPDEPSQPDQDCIDAIAENEEVIARMEERIALVRAEVEGRGVSWREFRSKEEEEAEDGVAADATNGTEEDEQDDGREHAPDADTRDTEMHEAWRDGTFQSGTIRNGEVHLNGYSRPAGGTLSDEELRRRMQMQMEGLEDDDDEGMHL